MDKCSTAHVTEAKKAQQAELDAALKKYLADGNKVNGCVPHGKPRLRKLGVKVQGYGLAEGSDKTSIERRVRARRDQLDEYKAGQQALYATNKAKR